jgi:hypothetical protein
MSSGPLFGQSQTFGAGPLISGQAIPSGALSNSQLYPYGVESTLSLTPSTQQIVLIFLKSLASPVVLYAENAPQLYEEIKVLIKQAQHNHPKLIEKPGMGPLKKVCFLDTELSGVALQSDPPGTLLTR